MSKKYSEYKAKAAMDAEQILAYFVNRDIMNSFVHLDNHERGLNTRYSPITLAAERVMLVVWEDAFGNETSAPNIRSISGRE